MTILKKLGDYGPVIFGIAFIAPLVAQSLDAASLSAPFGLPNMAFGLILGTLMGTLAKLRGTWV